MNYPREVLRNIRLSFIILILSLFPISCAYEQQRISAVSDLEKLSEEVKKSPSIIDFNIEDKDKVFEVVIKGSQPLAYVAFQLSTPPEVIIDLPATDIEIPLKPLILDNPIIKEIKMEEIERETQKFARIMIELKQLTGYKVKQEGNLLFVDIDKIVADEAVKVKDQKTPEKKKATEIKDIQINPQKEGIEVLIKANGDIENYSTFTLRNPMRLIIDINNVTYSPEEKSIKVESPFLKKIRIGKDEKKVRFVAELAETVPPFQVIKGEEKLILTIGKILPLALREEKKEIIENKRLVLKGDEKQFKEEKMEVTVKESKDKEKTETEYAGQKISLDFKDADIRNVLRLVADACNQNIITGENVKGKVTLKLKDVPCDQVMDIILTTNNLGKLLIGNVYRIDTNAAIKEFEQARYEAKTASLQMEDLVTEIIDINFAKAKDLKKILEEEKHLFSERGSAVADERTNKLIIQDVQERVEAIKSRINVLDQPTRQVLIEARIVQANPTYTKELGIQWGGIYKTRQGEKEITFKGTAGNNYVVNLPAPVGQGSGGGIDFGMITDSLSLDVALTALEKDEKLKIISNPKILGLDNKECVIKQGVQLPYLKLSEQGVTSTEFKDAVLEIKATPHITSSGSVIIHLEVKKDQKSAQTGAGGEPGIDTRQAITDLLVEDGKTVVIGGIYEETITHNISGVPYLMKLPLLGRFFRNVSDKLEKTELLIFLTVTVVKSKPIA